MALAFIYLTQRFFYRIFEFLRHWYVKSMKIYLNFVINRLETLDYYLAWKITLKNLFHPLYGDYSFIGYTLGFIFRLARLILASIIYAFIFIFAAAFYIFWLAIPLILIYKIFAP